MFVFEGGKEEGEPLLWGRIKNHDGKVITVWPPSIRRFKAVVEDKTLPGRVSEGSVYLGDLDGHHLDYIMSKMDGAGFEWADPVVVVRSAP